MSCRKAHATLISMLLVYALLLGGCSVAGSEDPDFSGIRSIAEFSTLRCYYHNVAEVRNDGTDLLFGSINVGYKKAWYEYRGYVDLGIDMNKVVVRGPDEGGVVSVEIPEVEIFDVQAEEDSIKEVCVDAGAFQTITNEEKAEAYSKAQSEMRDVATSDVHLSRQAAEHARALIEEYVSNVGNSMGKTYAVTFNGPGAE